MAARAAEGPAMRRGAFGASLALHGLIAAAAVLPFLRPEPVRPSAPGALEVVWTPSAAPPGTEAAAAPADTDDPASEPVEPFEEAPPLAPDLAAFAPPAPAAEPLPEPPPLAPNLSAFAPPPPPPEPLPEPEALRVPDAPAPPLAETPPEPAHDAPQPDPPPVQVAEPLPLPPPAAPVPPQAATPRPPPRPAAPRQAQPRQPPRAEAAAEPTSGGSPGPVHVAAAAPAAPAMPPGPVLITAPRYRSPPSPPVYPPRAVEFGLTGTVLVRAHVAPDGSTGETRVWRSSGHALLDAAALAAVRRWAFEPASVGGRRVEAWVEVPVHFRLN
jgi:TonB family protein